MRKFTEFSEWVDALMDDWDEEYYRAIYDVYGNISSLLEDRKPFSLYYQVHTHTESDPVEYHFIHKRYATTLIITGKEALSQLETYLAERFRVGESTPQNWNKWHDRKHDLCWDDRFDWVSEY